MGLPALESGNAGDQKKGASNNQRAVLVPNLLQVFLLKFFVDLAKQNVLFVSQLGLPVERLEELGNISSSPDNGKFIRC